MTGGCTRHLTGQGGCRDCGAIEELSDLRRRFKIAIKALEDIEARSYGELDDILTDIPTIARNALALTGRD